MTPAAPPRAPPSLRHAIVPGLGVAGAVCAALAWWLAGGRVAGAWTGPLVALLVLLPTGFGALVIMRRDQTVRHARAAIGRSTAQTQAAEQALKAMVHERDQLARAQHKASAEHQKLARESATDGLTGVTNRRHFDEILTVEWSRAARNRTSLGLLIIDIDHFKRYNDHYGHVAGDECLRSIAQLLQTLVRRAGELLARYGGEEFVILLPGAGVAQVEDMARRCLDTLALAALPHASSPTARHVTVSIGIAQAIPDGNQDPRTIVNAADAAMYRAKTAGRARHALASQADWDIDKDAPRTQPGELR